MSDEGMTMRGVLETMAQIRAIERLTIDIKRGQITVREVRERMWEIHYGFRHLQYDELVDYLNGAVSTPSPTPPPANDAE